MTAKEAQRIMNRYYPLSPAPLDLGPSPSAQRLQEEAMYVIAVEDEGVSLYFNHDRKLIRIEKWSRRGEWGRAPKQPARHQ